MDEDHEEDSTDHEQKVCCNKELIPCKFMFICFNGAFGSLMAFSNLFYVSSGLTPAAVGLSNGIGNGCAMLAGPMWGALADSTKHRKLLLLFLWLSSTLITFSKPWIVMLVSKVENNVTCVNSTNISSYGKTTKEECQSQDHLMNPDVLFYTILGVGILSSIMFSGFGTYMEGIIVNVIYTRKTKATYGQQKVFSPLGAAAGSFISGVAIDHYKPKHLSPYAAAFYMYLAFNLLMAPFMYILTNQAKWDHGKKKGSKISVREHLLSVLKNVDHVIFLMCVFISGFLFCLYFDFLSIFMRDTMNPSKTTISLVTVSSMFSELCFYPFSSQIIKLCGGPISSMFIGIFSYIPRFLLTSFCTNAWYMLPIQLLQGIGLSLTWTAMVEHAYSIFPKEITTTALGLLLNIHFMASSILTNILGGQVYQIYGGPILFQGGACISGAWCIVMILYFGVYKYSRSAHHGYNTFVDGSIQNVEAQP